MAAELRWILLALSVPLLAGIWWWTARRSRLAPGNAELRETPPESAPLHAPQPADHSLHAPALHEAASYESALDHRTDAGARDFGVPPFEPLNIRTAGFEDVPIIDMAMTAGGEPVEVESLDVGAAREPQEIRASPERREPREPHEMPEARERHEQDVALSDDVSPAPRASNGVETQRIITLRVCADEASWWSGADLLAALENNGLAYGRYKVFHRKYSDGQTLFCAASLVEPGTFDLERMPHDEFRGLTLFAVLPGPADAVQTIDALTATAEELAAALNGTVQDSKGATLSAERAAGLRADAAQFQASFMT